MNPELMSQIGETITQMVAFGIFFFIIAKFAWPALTRVLDERATKIEEGFIEIRRQQSEAARLQAQYAEQLRGIEAEARQRIQEAVAEGNRVATEISTRAQQESAEMIERAQRSIRLDIEKARVELRGEIVNLTLGAAERLLHERLDDAAQRRLVDGFITELEQTRRN